MITQNEWEKENLLENASTHLKIEAILLADAFDNHETINMRRFINAVRKYQNDAETFAQQGKKS